LINASLVPWAAGGVPTLAAVLLCCSAGPAQATAGSGSPQLGRTFQLQVLRGHVEVRETADDGYRRRTGTVSVPVGAEVDTTSGVARLRFAQNDAGKVMTANVSLGEFLVQQEVDRARRRLKSTTLRMSGDDSVCTTASTSEKKKKKKRKGFIGKIKVDKQEDGKIAVDDGRSGQTAGTAVRPPRPHPVRGTRASAATGVTRWIVTSFCDRTEIETVSGNVRRGLTRAEVSPIFRDMRAGDRALQGCYYGVGTVTSTCIVLLNWALRDPRAPATVLGRSLLSVAVSVETLQSQAAVCFTPPGKAEACTPVALVLPQGGDPTLRYIDFTCLPTVGGTWAVRVRVDGYQVGARLVTPVTRTVASPAAVGSRACSGV
jgi:hypothetical protein